MNLSGVPLPQNEPERNAINRIIAWVNANAWADAIEPKRLAKEARELSLSDLLKAILFLKDKGIIEVRYRPISPVTHQIVRKDYKSIKELRQAMEIHDQSENSFDGWDAEFIQVYVPTEQWR